MLRRCVRGYVLNYTLNTVQGYAAIVYSLSQIYEKIGMCGRTACTLKKDTLQKACVYKTGRNGTYRKPDWRDAPSGLDYEPSLNIAPSEVTPVLLNESHLECDKADNRIILPMVWGMIPPWHKGSYKSHGLSTNNCRLEGMLTSNLYKPQLTAGRRCIVVCEGFYEWQTTKKTPTKQPYYIYAKQTEGVNVENTDSWVADWNETDGWQGPKLLYMAAVFGTWTSPEKKVFHSYSIITMESNDTMSWLHHRMPAILDSEEKLSAWLDHKNVPLEDAVKLLLPVEKLGWHPVGTYVNNSRSKVKDCNKPVDLTKVKQTASSKLMESWLLRPQKNENENEPKEKKRKTD